MLVFQSSCSKSCTEYHSHHSPSKRFHILHHFTCFNRYFHAQSDFYVWCPLSYQPTPVSSSMNRTFQHFLAILAFLLATVFQFPRNDALSLLSCNIIIMWQILSIMSLTLQPVHHFSCSIIIMQQVLCIVCLPSQFIIFHVASL